MSCLSDSDRKEIVNSIQARLRAGETINQIVPEKKFKKKDDKKEKKGKEEAPHVNQKLDKKLAVKEDEKKLSDPKLPKRKPEKSSNTPPKKLEKKHSSSSRSESSKHRSRTRSKTKRRRHHNRSSVSRGGRNKEEGPEEGEVTEIPKHLKKLMKKRGSRRRSTSTYSNSYKSKSTLSATKNKNEIKVLSDAAIIEAPEILNKP